MAVDSDAVYGRRESVRSGRGVAAVCGLVLTVLLSHSSRSLLGGDCNRNGIEDAEDIRLGASPDCNGNAFPDECDLAFGDLSFVAPRIVTVLPGAQDAFDVVGVTAVDLNGDGLLDLAAMNDSRSVLVTAMNRGGAEYAPASGISVEFVPGDWEWADFDGDGDLDAVLSSPTEMKLALLRNRGDGRFLTTRTTTLHVDDASVSQLGEILAADLDGDGDLDLVATAHPSSELLLLICNCGDAGFFVIDTLRAPGARLRLISAGDFSGDGRPDLLVSHEPQDPADRSVALFVNGGDWSFTVRSERATPPHCRQPIAGDFDGDGGLDVTDGCFLALNQGKGAFDAPLDLGQLGAGAWLQAEDVDGDGDLDLISIEAGDTARICQNDGTGAFSAAQRVDVGSHATVMKVADLDGDGALDLYAFRRGGGCGQGQVALVLSQNEGPSSRDRNRNSIPDECEPDCNRNGVPDAHEIAAGLSPDCNGNKLPDGCDHAATFAFAEPETWLESPSALSGIAAADLDGDRWPDLVTAEPASNRLWALFNNRAGHFDRRLSLTVGAHPRFVAAADLDLDGDIDLATANGNSTSSDFSVLLNDGDATSWDVRAFPLGAWPNSLHAVDFNGDGLAELLCSTYFGVVETAIVLLPNRGNGTFDAPLRLHEGHWSAPLDLDSDGDLDLLGSSAQFGLSVSWNRGDFGFEAPRRIASGSLRAAADLDGDRDVDLVVSDARCNEHVVLRNLGDGAFEVVDGLARGVVGEKAIAADLDGDGDEDLAFHEIGQLTVMANAGDGTFSAPIHCGRRIDRSGPALAQDLNGDTLPDLVLFATKAGLGRVGLVVAINTAQRPASVDRDGDGVPDECAAAGGQVPGDANQDLRLDLGDAMWLLWHLFVDSSSILPCGSVSVSRARTGDLELLDWSGDGRIRLEDPLSVLRWVFLGEAPARPPASGCVPIAGCPAACPP